MTDERYEVAKKYLCKWLPEETYSVCERRLRGKESDDICCLICVGNVFSNSAIAFFRVVLFLGTHDNRMSTVLDEFKGAFERTGVVFSRLIEKLKPDELKEERERFVEVVESKLQEDK